MMSTPLTATRWRDDRFYLQALNADGTAKSLAGCSLFFGVKLAPTKPLLIQAAIGVGISITNLAEGRFTLLLPALAKIGLSSLATYYWDVLVMDAGGGLSTPDGCSGTLTINESVATGAVIGVTTAAGNMAYRPEISGLDGGGVANLDGFDTSVLSLPYLFIIFVGGQRQEWLADTRGEGEAVDDPGAVPAAVRQTVLPDNWNAETNNVIWRRKA